MGAPLEVAVSRLVRASPETVRRVMFDARQDPGWMAAVTAVDVQGDLNAWGDFTRPGARVHRTGRFLGRSIRWTTEVESASPAHLDLRIVEGPMRGTVSYRIQPHAIGSRVSIRNTGDAPGFAPRRLLAWAMRRSLTADLARLQRLVEAEP